MAKTLQFRRYNTNTLYNIIGAPGELIVDSTTNTVTVHTGNIGGGVRLATEQYADTINNNLNYNLSFKQDTLTSGSNIKTINGQSLLGSGNLTISGGAGADLTQISDDVLPLYNEVYDIGSDTKRWNNVYVSNNLDINGSSITALDGTLVTTADVVVGSLLSDQVLISDNMITPIVNPSEYSGVGGWLIVNGNLNVDGELLQLPVAETITTTTETTTPAAPWTLLVDWNDLYGDGWNGNDVNIYADNTLIANYSQLMNGSIKTSTSQYSIPAGTNTLTFDYNPDGNYPTEPQLTKLTVVETGQVLWNQPVTLAFNDPWQISVLAVSPSATITTTTETVVPVPTTGVEGAIRFNKDDTAFEAYDGLSWKILQTKTNTVTSFPTGGGVNNIDFSDSSLRSQTGLNTHISYTANNYSVGSSVTVRIINDAPYPRNVTFPSGWTFVGQKPTEIASNKTAILTLTSFGTTELDCVASWAVKQ